MTGYKRLPLLPRTPAGAVKLQKELARKVIARDDFAKEEVETACGVDVSYRRDGMVAQCAAVVMDSSFNVLEQAVTKSKVTQPYIPGLFMLREAGPVLRTLKLLKRQYDVLMVDGHGQLHPRRCGLACFVGVTLDRPAIGVAKSLLCGTVRDEDGSIEIGGEKLGQMVNDRQYVSVGHRVSLETAVQIAKKFTRDGVPEPLKIADALSRR